MNKPESLSITRDFEKLFLKILYLLNIFFSSFKKNKKPMKIQIGYVAPFENSSRIYKYNYQIVILGDLFHYYRWCVIFLNKVY